MLRTLALAVAWISIVQLVAALLLALPHSDLPGQPFSGLAMVALAIGGFALAVALWRRRPSAARWLPAWGAGMLAFALAVMLAVASPTERREALPALAVAAPLWALLVWQLARWVRQRTTVPEGVS